MIEAFIVLLVGSILIVILNKMPEKDIAPSKHKKSFSKFLDVFHKNEKNDRKKGLGKKTDYKKDTEISSIEDIIEKADKLLAEEKLEEAEELYIHVLEKDEKNPQSYKGLGQICFKKKDYKDAYEIFDKLTKISPKDSSGYCNLGMCCFKQKKLKEAEENYRKALEIEKKPIYYKNLGITNLKAGKIDEACENLIKVLEKNSEDKETFNLILGVLGEINNKKIAKDAVYLLQRLDPKNPVLKRYSASLRKH